MVNIIQTQYKTFSLHSVNNINLLKTIHQLIVRAILITIDLVLK